MNKSSQRKQNEKPREEAPKKAPRASSEVADSELEGVSGGFGLGGDPQPQVLPGDGYGWTRPGG